MQNEIKAYAIQLRAVETMVKTKLFKEITEKTGYIGIHPDFPFAYVVYRTREEQIKAFKEFNKVFAYCKIVENVCYIPDPKQS